MCQYSPGANPCAPHSFARAGDRVDSGRLQTVLSDIYSMPPLAKTRRAASRSRVPKSKTESASERVARRFEDLVRAGTLRRGSRLPSEPLLARMLGVSRASLREAFKGLAFMGLLKSRAGDGTYLQPSMSSMAVRQLQWMLLLEEVTYPELYEMREMLEPAVAYLAAQRATAADLESMRRALDGMNDAIGDPRTFVRSEMEFHGAITRAARNRAVQSMMEMMYGALVEGKRRVLPMVTDLAGHCARHERIFQLIAAGKAAQARRAISADVRYAERLLSESLAASPTPAPSLESPPKLRQGRRAAPPKLPARRAARS
jgi:GntR family transcriptional regulator, transcriptional repressor for pyruvate dehydrogenase complex